MDSFEKRFASPVGFLVYMKERIGALDGIGFEGLVSNTSTNQCCHSSCHNYYLNECRQKQEEEVLVTRQFDSGGHGGKT